jgi:hypothetical protein
MSPEGFPRDPDKLELTRHGMNRMRDRNVGVREIRKCISEGDISPEEGDGPHEARYRLEMPGVDLLLVVDKTRMKIETVFWDDEQGATGGRLGSREDSRSGIGGVLLSKLNL